jgi:Zn-dependent peptidase ImmA (M78 family)
MLAKETQMIRQYLKQIGFDNVRVRKANETECDMLNGIIYFDKKWYDKKNKTLQAHDKVFQEYYAKKLNHKIKISMATYGLFHELGHLISMKDYEGKNFNKAFARYVVGIRKIKTKSLKKSLYQYRNLKMERLADKYAYAIYLLNEKSAIEFDKKMRKQFA